MCLRVWICTQSAGSSKAGDGGTEDWHCAEGVLPSLLFHSVLQPRTAFHFYLFVVVFSFVFCLKQKISRNLTWKQLPAGHLMGNCGCENVGQHSLGWKCWKPTRRYRKVTGGAQGHTHLTPSPTVEQSRSTLEIIWHLSPIFNCGTI